MAAYRNTVLRNFRTVYFACEFCLSKGMNDQAISRKVLFLDLSKDWAST